MTTEVSSMEPSSVKQLGKRRVFIFFYAIVGFALIPTIIQEMDAPTHAIDDIVLVAVGIALFAILARNWKRQSPADLVKANKIGMYGSIVFIVFVLVAFAFELNDVTDLADDIAKLFIGVALLVNSFI